MNFSISTLNLATREWHCHNPRIIRGTFSCSLEFAAKANREQAHDDDVDAYGYWFTRFGAHSIYWSC